MSIYNSSLEFIEEDNWKKNFLQNSFLKENLMFMFDIKQYNQIITNRLQETKTKNFRILLNFEGRLVIK